MSERLLLYQHHKIKALWYHLAHVLLSVTQDI